MALPSRKGARREVRTKLGADRQSKNFSAGTYLVEVSCWEGYYLKVEMAPTRKKIPQHGWSARVRMTVTEGAFSCKPR